MEDFVVANSNLLFAWKLILFCELKLSGIFGLRTLREFFEPEHRCELLLQNLNGNNNLEAGVGNAPKFCRIILTKLECTIFTEVSRNLIFF